MDAVVFYPHSVLRLSFFSAFSKQQLGRTIYSLKEIADGPPLFTSQRDHLQLTSLSIRDDGNRRGRTPRKNSATGRSPKGDGNKIPQSFDSKVSNSSNQEEIIALFRRIQSSISKAEPPVSPKSSEEKPSAESVLEVLLQSRKQVKGEKASNKEGDKVVVRRRGLLKKEDKKDYPSVADLKLTRPPSNFVKRSPIPSSSIPIGRLGLKSEKSPTTASKEELGLEKVEEMKLPALKELAKSRGIKGYSKLKKRVLIELLRSGVKGSLNL